MTEKWIKVRQIKSTIGCTKKVIANVRGLGLLGIGKQSRILDTPCVRGMLNKVCYLVKEVKGVSDES